MGCLFMILASVRKPIRMFWTLKTCCKYPMQQVSWFLSNRHGETIFLKLLENGDSATKVINIFGISTKN